MSELMLSVAGVTVGVKHRYSLAGWVCHEHKVVSGRLVPDFTVFATEEEIEKEYRRLNGAFDRCECESNCLYRKVCLGMLDYDGFLLHAAAVAVDGEGYVFTAPGGTGKSTHAAYWLRAFGNRAFMINGDKPFIRRMNGRFFVCGTPWRGKEQLGCSDQISLKAVCLLERGNENEIALADMDTVIDRIFRQVLLPEAVEQVIRQLDLLDQLIQNVPVYHLKCNKSTEAALVAYNGIRRQCGEVAGGYENE